MDIDKETLKVISDIVRSELSAEIVKAFGEDAKDDPLTLSALDCSSDLTLEYMQYMYEKDDEGKQKHLDNMKHIKQTLKHIENVKKYEFYSTTLNIMGKVIAKVIIAGISTMV